jgi:hypothetical protein
MKRLFLGTLLLALLIVLPIPAMAGVDVNVNISLPPPIVFAGPPEMVVLPETNIYVVPDSDVDIFFLGWLVVASVGRTMVSLTLLQLRVGLLSKRSIFLFRDTIGLEE